MHRPQVRQLYVDTVEMRYQAHIALECFLLPETDCIFCDSKGWAGTGRPRDGCLVLLAPIFESERGPAYGREV